MTAPQQEPASLWQQKPELAPRRAVELVDMMNRGQWHTERGLIIETVKLVQTYGEAIGTQRRNVLNESAEANLPHGPGSATWQDLVRLDKWEDVDRAVTHLLSGTKKTLQLGPGEDMLPTTGWFGDYLTWTAGGQTPTAFHFWCAVAAMAACCRRAISVDRGQFRVYGATSVILTGDSGTGKSHAIDCSKDLIDKINHDVWLESEETFSKQGLLDLAERRIRVLPENITPERLVSLMGTGPVREAAEALGDNVWEDATGLFIVRELGTLLDSDNFGRRRLVNLMLALCDCVKEYQVGTQKRGEEALYNVALTMIAGTTPRWVRTQLTEDLFLEGLTGRWMFVHREMADEGVLRPPALDPVMRDRLADRLKPIALADRTSMEIDQDAERAFLEPWYQENWQTARKHAEKRGYYMRKDKHVIRLAMMLAISDGAYPTIYQEHLEQALKIVNYEEGRAEEVFTHIGADREITIHDFVYNKILEHADVIGHTELYRKCAHRVARSRAFKEVIEALKERGLIKQVAVKQTKGRSSIGYEVLKAN